MRDLLPCAVKLEHLAHIADDVADDGAVAVGAAVQAFSVAVGGDLVAEQTGQDDAVAELAGRAEQDDLLVDGGRVPLTVGTGPGGDPW